MGLTRCRVCRGVVSTRTELCPYCGTQEPAKPEWPNRRYFWTSLVVVFVAIVLAQLLVWGPAERDLDEADKQLEAVERELERARQTPEYEQLRRWAEDEP